MDPLNLGQDTRDVGLCNLNSHVSESLGGRVRMCLSSHSHTVFKRMGVRTRPRTQVST